MENNVVDVGLRQNESVRFNLISLDELAQRPPMKWIVKNLLPAEGLAIMYGKSGSGKTFLLLDLLLSIASGIDWFGHQVNQTPVCLVCLEGVGGMHQRIEAWKKATGRSLPSNFRIITEPFELGKQLDVHQLAESIKHFGYQNGVIAIDTLNAATPRMDENSSKEMGNAIDNLKLLKRLTGGLVMPTHHTGKDEGQGLRGHSSLHGAVDSEIYLKITKSGRTWQLEKIRDYESGEIHNFKLVAHELETDEDGEIITSCTIESELPKFEIRQPTGKNQHSVFNSVSRYLNDACEITGSNAVVPIEEAINKASTYLTNIERHKRNNEARKILHKLIEKNYFQLIKENQREYVGFI